VTVDYSTERNQLNRITVFDRIAESVRAAHIKEPKARLPFPFTLSDQGRESIPSGQGQIGRCPGQGGLLGQRGGTLTFRGGKYPLSPGVTVSAVLTSEVRQHGDCQRLKPKS